LVQKAAAATFTMKWAWFWVAVLLAPHAWAQTPGAIPIPDDPNVRVLAQLANPPDGRIDYARVQTAIERAVNPAFNAVAFNAELDHWANIVHDRPALTDPDAKLV
jgi:hypothetical protein